MENYITESGYEVRETLGGLEVSEDDKVICTLDGKTLGDYLNDDETINDELLENDIKDMEETEDFLAYQAEYC